MNNKIALNWINNQWVDNKNYKESFNPATGEVIGMYADGGKQEAMAAITAAKKAFKDSEWKTNRQLRYKVINQLADQFELYHDRLVEMLMLENGKVRSEAEFECWPGSSEASLLCCISANRIWSCVGNKTRFI